MGSGHAIRLKRKKNVKRIVNKYINQPGFVPGSRHGGVVVRSSSARDNVVSWGGHFGLQKTSVGPSSAGEAGNGVTTGFK
jgi:hypothetical protein